MSQRHYRIEPDINDWSVVADEDDHGPISIARYIQSQVYAQAIADGLNRLESNRAPAPSPQPFTMHEQPMVEWEATYNRLTVDERAAIEKNAAVLAERCARLSAYISRRQTGGKHADAVMAQNRAARGTRQALGYTYADGKVTF